MGKGGQHLAPMEERRKSHRVSVTMPVEIHVRQTAKKELQRYRGRITNVGESGIGLVFPNGVSVAPILTLHFKTPRGASLQVDAKPVWSAPARNGDLQCGLFLPQLEFHHLAAIHELLWDNEQFAAGQLDHILSRIKPGDADIRSRVMKWFMTDISGYLRDITATYRTITEGGLSPAEGQQKIDDMTDRFLAHADAITEAIDDKIIAKEIKRAFRSRVYDWVYQSRIGQRTIERPRGYQGDYKTIDIFYDNKPLSEGLGLYFDTHILTRHYAVAVRNRLHKMVAMLEEFVSQSRLETIKILNVACGPCREMLEWFALPRKAGKNLLFTCLDQDQEALEYSKEKLRNLSEGVELRFVAEDVANMVKKPEQSAKLLRTQHLIYSVGLADYLPDRILRKMVHFCFDLLEPNGQLVVTHKDRAKHKPITPDWLCDWTFISRDEEQFLDVLQLNSLPGASCRVERDESQLIMFFFITKGIQTKK